MALDLLPIPAFSDNYIWRFRVGARVWLVDPGDAQAALAAIDSAETLAGVLITHHHADHIGGLAELAARPGVQLIGPDDRRIEPLHRRVGDGDTVDCDGARFAVIATPGHTRSHVVYHGEGVLFAGDTLFSLGCGRLFEGTPEQMLASLDRLTRLPDATRLACTHEYTWANARFALAVEPDNPALAGHLATLRAQQRGSAARPTLPSTLAVERACNPFLRIDQPAVRRAVAAQAGIDPSDRLACFAALRRWKDDFRV